MKLIGTNIRFVLFTFAIFPIGLYGFEGKYWEKTYGGPEREIGWSVQVTRDGGYVIGGLTRSFGAGDVNFYLIKTDSEGNMEWERNFGDDRNNLCVNVQITSNEGYILCGTTGFGTDDSDIFIVKTDSKGLVEWEKTYGGSQAESGGSIKQTRDRGYIICGETSSFGAGESDIYLIKINSKGEKEWEKTYGGPSRDWGHTVQLTSDGGYIIGCNTASYGQGKLDVYLIKTDIKGNKEWDKTYGGTEDEYIWGTEGLIQTKDEGYIFCALSESYGEGMNDFYILKISSSGKIEWQKTFGGTKEDGPLSILQTQDSGYLICGYTKSFGAGDRDVYLIKIDKNGKKEWEKTYGGPDFDCGIAMQKTTDGGIIICGETESYGSGERDVYLVKTNFFEDY